METEPFQDTFGPKAQRKRPRIDVGSFEELGNASAEAAEEEEKKDEAELAGDAGASTSSTITNMKLILHAEPAETEAPMPPTHANYIEPIYFKGTSRRIYGELYKVIDSSDVVLHVLDARDPFGTMCESVLDFIRKEKAHKQVVLIINKCDLVPNWVTVSWASVSSLFPSLLHHGLCQVLCSISYSRDRYGRGRKK